MSTPKVAPYFPDAPPLEATPYRMPIRADVSPRTPPSPAPAAGLPARRASLTRQAPAPVPVLDVAKRHPPAAVPAASGPSPEEAEAAIAAERHDLYERWSRPLFGIGFRAYFRGWLVAYPHRVGYAFLAFAAVSVLAHLAGGNVARPTTAFLGGIALVASDRISLKHPWLRLLAYSVGMVVGVLVDEATKNTFFRGWDR